MFYFKKLYYFKYIFIIYYFKIYLLEAIPGVLHVIITVKNITKVQKVVYVQILLHIQVQEIHVF